MKLVIQDEKITLSVKGEIAGSIPVHATKSGVGAMFVADA